MGRPKVDNPKVALGCRVDPGLKTQLEAEAKPAGFSSTSSYVESLLLRRGEAKTGSDQPGLLDEPSEVDVGDADSARAEAMDSAVPPVPDVSPRRRNPGGFNQVTDLSVGKRPTFDPRRKT